MAALVKIVKLLIVLFLAIQAASQELNSTLHTTLYGVEVAYVDETIVFTCVVRGSNSMAWTSEEYIGTGGQRLELSTAEAVGTNYSAVGNRQTVAVLVYARMDEIIVSQLHIRIRSNDPIASVWCHNINANTATSIQFLLADATTIDCDKWSVCPEEIVTCMCTAGNSNMLAWASDGDRVIFGSTDPLGTRRNVTGTNTFAILTNISNRNGISVITSNLTFIASSSMSNTVKCENVDQSTSKSTIIPITDFSIRALTESCIATTAQVTTPGDGDSDLATNTCAGPIAAAVVVPVIIVIAVIPIIVITLVACYKIKTLNTIVNNKDQKIRTLEETNTQLEQGLKHQEERINELISEKDKLNSKLSSVNNLLQSKIYEWEQANRMVNNLKSEMNDLRQQNRQLRAEKYKSTGQSS